MRLPNSIVATVPNLKMHGAESIDWNDIFWQTLINYWTKH